MRDAPYLKQKGLAHQPTGEDADIHRRFAEHKFEETFPIKDLSTIAKDKLHTKGNDGISRHIQLVFFHESGDHDGVNSFGSMRHHYEKQLGFRTQASPVFDTDKPKPWIAKKTLPGGGEAIVYGIPIVENRNQGKHVAVASNPALAMVQDEIKKHGVQPQMFIYRGHSYGAGSVVPHIPPSVAVVDWGSCGGYRLMTQSLLRAPDAAVIGTSGTGSTDVNDPKLVEITRSIVALRNPKDSLHWDKTWDALTDRLKHHPRASKLLKSYVAPHTNSIAQLLSPYLHIAGTHGREIDGRNPDHFQEGQFFTGRGDAGGRFIQGERLDNADYARITRGFRRPDGIQPDTARHYRREHEPNGQDLQRWRLPPEDDPRPQMGGPGGGGR